MQLPDIPDDLMAKASKALDDEIKASGDPVKARAAFDAVLKGGTPEPETDPVGLGDKDDQLSKPARKPRSDKGKPRKQAPPRVEDLPAPTPETTAAPAGLEQSEAEKIGRMVMDLFAALKG